MHLQVKNAINEKDPARAAQIERAVLEGLDRVQRAWLSQGTTADTRPTLDTPSQSMSISCQKSLSINAKRIVLDSSSLLKPPLLRRLTQGKKITRIRKITCLRLQFTDVFNVTVLVNYGRENIGSMLSIVESVWTIMKGNLSLVFKSTTAVLSILLVGGTAILNFLVNGVGFQFLPFKSGSFIVC